MSDFARDVTRWCERAKANSELAFINIAGAALARVRELTPVKTGYLRANWQVAVGTNYIAKDQLQSQQINALNMELGEIKLGQVIFILNPVVYARRIEYGFVGYDSLHRFYNQKGVGMVAQTMRELPSIARQVLSDLRGQ